MPLSYEVHTLKVMSEDIKNYCYVIVDKATRQAAVVDPAWELDPITDLLHQQGADLKLILLTHSHDDHVNLVPALTEQYDVSVHMSRLEIDFAKYEYPSLHAFEDSDRLELGSTTIQCLVTPGHTQGSTCFLLEEDLFTGDTLFVEGCGSCFSEGGNAESMYDSIQRLKQTISPRVRIRSGHSFGEEPGQPMEHLWTNNIYFHLEKPDFIAFRMRKNQSLLRNFK